MHNINNNTNQYKALYWIAKKTRGSLTTVVGIAGVERTGAAVAATATESFIVNDGCLKRPAVDVPSKSSLKS